MADKSDDPKSPFNMNIEMGKEIDRSLGKIITALLKPAATELGGMLGDSFGFVADRIRQKRLKNTQIGLDEVRKKLNSANINIDDIKSIREEDLYLIIEGFSLNDDEKVRDLWAGMFAEAINPNNNTMIQRPFISILQSLSARDVRVVYFIASDIKFKDEMKSKIIEFKPASFSNITPEEKLEMERIMKHNRDLYQHYFEKIDTMVKEYVLNFLEKTRFADNLLRQGVVERIPLRESFVIDPFTRLLDEIDPSKLIDHLRKQMDYLRKTSERNSESPDYLYSGGHPWELELRFTGFGYQFAESCGLL